MYGTVLPLARQHSDSDITDYLHTSDERMPAGVYGMAVAVFIQDSRRMLLARQKMGTFPMARMVRLAVSVWMVYSLLLMQFWVTMETLFLVTPLSVHAIRETYNRYETVMYRDSDGTSHTYKNRVGNARGIDGYFNAKNFEALTSDEKDTVCMIPLTVPSFTLVILLIWALTCMGEVRRVLSLWTMVYDLPRVDSMMDSLSFEGVNPDAGESRVVGITVYMKTFICGGVLLPRLLMALVLLWLGSRWLLATTGFGDVLLNSIALDFILLLQDMVYMVLVPRHTQVETEGTIVPTGSRSSAEVWRFLNTFGYAAAAVVFVLTYFYLWQQVLIDYKWDVKQVCQQFLEDRLKQ